LAVAAWRSKNQWLRFKPGPIELTVEATVTSKVEGRAGVRWWIVEAGGGGSSERAATHTVKLVLDPVMFNQAGQQVELLVDDVDEPAPALAGDEGLDDSG
jgi:Trypsin-co-occurring domain 2